MTERSGLGTAWHLVRRFFGSLPPRGPSAADDQWARSWLLPGEAELWRRMSSPDRRHAVAVARRVHRAAAPVAGERAVMAAALMHDVGKTVSGLGTWRRAGATAVAFVLGRERAARSRGSLGRYLRHDQLGADLLVAAGSEELTVAWARQHHLPPGRWTVPLPIGSALKAADDD